ncbi:MAG: hypothetical protein WAW52_00040 [Methanothrix sp.]
MRDLTMQLNSLGSDLSWAHALMNVGIAKIEPEPLWHIRATDHIKGCQNICNEWIRSTFPEILAKIPYTLLDFSDFFLSSVPIIQDIAKKSYQTQLSETDRKTLKDIFQEMIRRVDSYILYFNNALTSLDDYSTKTEDFYSKLEDDSKFAIAEAQRIDSKIAEINGRLSILQKNLAEVSTKASVGQISEGTSMFSMVISLTFGLALSGGVLSLGGFAAGALSIGVGLVTTSIYTEQIVNNLNKICEVISELSDQEKQIAILQGIISTFENLSNGHANLKANIVSMNVHWLLMQEKIQNIIQLLEQPVVYIEKVNELSNILLAKNEWMKLEKFAKNIQAAIVVPPDPLILYSEIKAR